MKPLRILSLTLVLLITGLGFTSCIDDDDNSSTGVYYSIGKLHLVSGYYYLETSNGYIIYPTSSSMSSLESSSSSSAIANMVGHVVLFCYYAEISSLTSSSTYLSDVTAYAIVDMQDDVEYVEEEGDDNDVEEDAPIVSIEQDDAYPYFFDETTLILPIEYYINYYVHENTLVYYPDETDGTTITLHLRHSLGDDTSVSVSDYTTYYWASYSVAYYYLYFRAFDISEILDEVTPSTIIIKYKEADSLSLDDATEKSYTLSYSY